MKVLVTGGSGFIGSHLVDHLLTRNKEVVVLDDFSSGKREYLDQALELGGVEIVEGSILDNDVLAKAIEGCDVVYHMAVQCVRRSLSQPLENHQINATGTLNVLEEARKKNVGRFVYCSSSEVYGNTSSKLLDEDTAICQPMTVYGAAKLTGELYAKAYYRTYGLPTTIVRPFNAYGPRAHDKGDLAEVIPRFIMRARNDLPPIIFGNADNGRDFTYVSEVAAAIVAAAECDAIIGDIVNIAYGKMITIGEVASSILKLCQKRKLVPRIIENRPGDVHVLRADTGKAERLLGFKANIPFESGLEKYLDWLMDRYPDATGFLEDDVINWSMPD